MKPIYSLLLLAVAVANAQAALSPATWSSTTATTATGDLNGITISATSNAEAPIVGISTGFFGSGWDGSMPLGPDAMGLVVSNVNGGDSQTFTFSSPLLDGTVMYIENFDSASGAAITFTGATSNQLIDSSPSIVYGSVPGFALMGSTNFGFDGEGDAAILLNGPVTEIKVDYVHGLGDNGVIYTFAAPDPVSVPEPTSAFVMAGLFGLGGSLVCLRRKQKLS